MRPPKSFHDFTLQFHQDLDLVYPGWASESPSARHELYENFRRGFGDRAVNELAAWFRLLLNDKDADFGSLWFNESKADWIISSAGVRRLVQDFAAWASSM